MKQFNQNSCHKLLSALFWLLLATPGAWAQANQPTGPGNSFISGETQIRANETYSYRHSYEPVDGVYWHVVGAAAINGVVANQTPDGQVDATARTIQITWAWAQTSHVQLMTRTKDGQETVLADLVVTNTARATSMSNKIQFHGQVPDTQTNQRLDPLDVCPNVVDPTSHDIQSLPYQFQFESNCSGNNASWPCRFRPNFLWTIKYFTAAGTFYQEKWQDQTIGDFSKVRLYLYDRVPYPAARFVAAATPTNSQATQAGGNTKFSAVPYPNTACIMAETNTALAGDLITRVQLECTGYSCGYSSWGDDNDVIQIRYYGRQPDAIAVNGPSPLCRNTPYPISVSSVFAATNYVWYTSGLNGAVISGVNGSNATLNLSGVPAGTTSITLRVAAQDNAHCGNITSTIRELVVNIAPSPAAPQGIELTGRCPSPDLKSIRVINVSNSLLIYNWTVTGTGAYFDVAGIHQTTVPSTYATQSLVTPSAANVVVTATLTTGGSSCNGNSVTTSQAFQIDNTVLPSGLAISSPRLPCSTDLSLAIVNPQAGVLYSMSQPYNLYGATAATLTQTSPGSSTAAVTWNSKGSGGFDMFISAGSDCPRAQTGYTVHGTVEKFLPSLGCRAAPAVSNGEPVTTVLLYPNPTDGQVTITSDEGTAYQWAKVVDVQGRVVQQVMSSSEAGVTGFDVHKLPAGLYQVQLFDGVRLTTQRITKQ